MSAGKTALTLGIVGGGIYALYRILSPGTASAAPAQPGASNVPNAYGMLAKTGDRVLVPASAILSPPGALAGQLVTVLLDQANVGQDPVLGHIVDAPSLPSGPNVTVRRADIQGIVSSSPISPVSPVNPPGGPAFLSNPAQLETGKKYRARIEVPPQLVSFATIGAVSDQFAAVGFSDVSAYHGDGGSPPLLPTDWPAVTAQNPSAATYFVEGVWTQPSATIPLPAGVASAWLAP